jgi:hypothetical protein
MIRSTVARRLPSTSMARTTRTLCMYPKKKSGLRLITPPAFQPEMPSVATAQHALQHASAARIFQPSFRNVPNQEHIHERYTIFATSLVSIFR